MTTGLILSIWWGIGFLSFWVFIVFYVKEITITTLIGSLLATACGPATALVVFAVLVSEDDHVLWRKK